jgi:hypothetical protein
MHLLAPDPGAYWIRRHPRNEKQTEVVCIRFYLTRSEHAALRAGAAKTGYPTLHQYALALVLPVIEGLISNA